MRVHADGGSYELTPRRLARAPAGSFEVARRDVAHVGVVRLFSAPGTASQVLVTRVAPDEPQKLRLLVPDEIDAVLAIEGVEATHASFLRERLVAPDDPLVAAALVELDTTGGTEMIEATVARRAREEAARRRSADVAASPVRIKAASFGTDSRRTRDDARHAGMMRDLSLSLSSAAIGFGMTSEVDFGSRDAFERVIECGRDKLGAHSLPPNEFRLLSVTISIAACQEQGKQLPRTQPKP